MASLSQVRILDTVRDRCPGALDGTMRRELFNTEKEFFARTNAWLVEIAINIVTTTNDYQLDTCQNAVINRLMLLGRPDSSYVLPPSYLPTCPPQYFAMLTTGGQEAQDPLFRSPRDGLLLSAGIRNPILRIRWNPMVNETWIGMFAFNIGDPTDKDGLPDGPPDWLIEKYYDYLTAGVTSRLMMTSGKGYSSPQGAAFYGRKYNEGVGLARTEVRDMFKYGAQRWAFPQGWNYRQPRRYG